MISFSKDKIFLNITKVLIGFTVLCISIIIFSCRQSTDNETNSKTDERLLFEELKLLINENKAKRLFLDFYYGMQKESFLLVKDKLIKGKKLTENGRYDLTYYIPDYEVYRNISLKVLGTFDNEGELVELILHDGEFDPSSKTINDDTAFSYIPIKGIIDIKSLVETFKLKYGEFQNPYIEEFGKLQKDTTSFMFFEGEKKILLTYYSELYNYSDQFQDFQRNEIISLSIKYSFESKEAYNKRVRDRAKDLIDSVSNIPDKYEKKVKESINDI